VSERKAIGYIWSSAPLPPAALGPGVPSPQLWSAATALVEERVEVLLLSLPGDRVVPLTRSSPGRGGPGLASAQAVMYVDDIISRLLAQRVEALGKAGPYGLEEARAQRWVTFHIFAGVGSAIGMGLIAGDRPVDGWLWAALGGLLVAWAGIARWGFSGLKDTPALAAARRLQLGAYALSALGLGGYAALVGLLMRP
jgi:hypothetical protein